MRDGTRLAIDIIHPAVNGVPIPGKLPIVLQATPYQRALVQNGQVVNAADNDHADQLGRKAKAQMAALSAAARGPHGDRDRSGHRGPLAVGGAAA